MRLCVSVCECVCFVVWVVGLWGKKASETVLTWIDNVDSVEQMAMVTKRVLCEQITINIVSSGPVRPLIFTQAEGCLVSLHINGLDFTKIHQRTDK